MSGGGDTPPTNTWKFGIGGPAFIAGDFNEEGEGEYVLTVYSQAVDNVNKALVIIDGHAKSYLNDSVSHYMEHIVTEIEEKFGISVSEWIYLTGRYSVGDDVAYWDTYEVIS